MRVAIRGCGGTPCRRADDRASWTRTAINTFRSLRRNPASKPMSRDSPPMTAPSTFTTVITLATTPLQLIGQSTSRRSIGVIALSTIHIPGFQIRLQTPESRRKRKIADRHATAAGNSPPGGSRQVHERRDYPEFRSRDARDACKADSRTASSECARFSATASVGMVASRQRDILPPAGRKTRRADAASGARPSFQSAHPAASSAAPLTS